MSNPHATTVSLHLLERSPPSSSKVAQMDVDDELASLNNLQRDQEESMRHHAERDINENLARDTRAGVQTPKNAQSAHLETKPELEAEKSALLAEKQAVLVKEMTLWAKNMTLWAKNMTLLMVETKNKLLLAHGEVNDVSNGDADGEVQGEEEPFRTTVVHGPAGVLGEDAMITEQEEFLEKEEKEEEVGMEVDDEDFVAEEIVTA